MNEYPQPIQQGSVQKASLFKCSTVEKRVQLFCIFLLLLWVLWWTISLQQQDLLFGKHLWFPPAFGVDFYRHVDRPARIWWNGGNPYMDTVAFFPYPPSEMRFFAWVNLFAPKTALTLWLAMLAMLTSFSAFLALRWRRYLFLEQIPFLPGIILMLFSTPVLFAMERGQYDPLSLLFILAALPLLHQPSKWLQFIAGAILCLAPWTKIYPGLLLIGLIGLKRWRALAGFCLTGLVLIALFDKNEVLGFLVNNARHIEQADSIALFCSGKPCPWNHPLGYAIASLWLDTQFSSLGLIPGKIIGFVILMAPLFWVTFNVYRCPHRDRLALPYFLWIVALSTFIPPVSNDYNLIFLPLSVLAAWDRRDPWLAHICIALLALWWQPFNLLMTGMPLLLIKLTGLFGVGISLRQRAREQTCLT